jgi:hypothetical protein
MSNALEHNVHGQKPTSTSSIQSYHLPSHWGVISKELGAWIPNKSHCEKSVLASCIGDLPARCNTLLTRISKYGQ